MPDSVGHGRENRVPCRKQLLAFVVLGCALAVQSLARAPTAVAQVATASPELVIPIHMSVKEANEAPFPIELKYGDKIAQESWIEIVTLPAAVTFSSGGVQRRGVWRVALAEARNLRIKVPAQTATDNGSIYVMLVEKGVIQTVATAKLVITPQPAAAIAEAASALPSQAAPPDARASAPAVNEDKSRSVAKKLNRAEKSVDGTAPMAPAATASQPAPQATPNAAVAAPATPAVVPLPTTVPVPAARTQTAATTSPAPTLPPAPVTPPAAATQTAAVAPPAPAMPPAPATPPAIATQPVATASAPPTLPPAPAQPAPAAQPALSLPSPSVAAAPPVVSQAAPIVAVPPAAAVQIQRFLSQGERNFAEGNISVARQYFTSAAELGSAIGAFKLAETNDPHELQKIQVVGLKPDVSEAIRWYRKASDLGMSEAAERARRLQQR